jgi:hypothetical protein
VAALQQEVARKETNLTTLHARQMQKLTDEIEERVEKQVTRPLKPPPHTHPHTPCSASIARWFYWHSEQGDSYGAQLRPDTLVAYGRIY